MLWDELLKEVILHITPLFSLLHILLKDGECVCRTSENCKSLVLQDKYNIEIFCPPWAGIVCVNKIVPDQKLLEEHSDQGLFVIPTLF